LERVYYDGNIAVARFRDLAQHGFELVAAATMVRLNTSAHGVRGKSVHFLESGTSSRLHRVTIVLCRDSVAGEGEGTLGKTIGCSLPNDYFLALQYSDLKNAADPI
jgi:hypothetical protein